MLPQSKEAVRRLSPRALLTLVGRPWNQDCG